jgi:membrane-associated phospholipid phosphatase
MHASRRRPLLLGELAVVLTLVSVSDWIRGPDAARASQALAHAHDLLAAERVLHLDIELTATRWLSAHTVVSTLASWWYQLAHVTVTLGVLGWCYVSRPDVYRRFRTALMLANVAALVVYVVFPVMPPRLLPGGQYADAVAAAGFGGVHAGMVATGQYGAMPSLHVAWATWSAAVLQVLVRRRAVLLYPMVTAASVLLTGNHYVLDVLAGISIAVLALRLTRPRITFRLIRTGTAPAGDPSR